MGAGGSKCHCCQSAAQPDGKITVVKRDPPTLAIHQPAAIASPTDPVASRHRVSGLPPPSPQAHTPSTPSFRGDSPRSPHLEETPQQNYVSRPESPVIVSAPRETASPPSPPPSPPVVPRPRSFLDPPVQSRLGSELASSISSGFIRRMVKRTNSSASTSSSSSSNSTPAPPAAAKHRPKQPVQPSVSTSSSSSATTTTRQRPRISISVPVDDLGEGCYLQYSTLSQGTLSAVWSKSFPGTGDGSAYLAFLRPPRPVPAFKYKGASRRQDLVKHINTNKAEYFRGWVSFLKLARTNEANVIFLDGVNEVPAVKIVAVSVSNRLRVFRYNQWEEIGDARAVAVIPGGSEIFAGVNSLDATLLVQKAHECGGAAVTL